MVAPYSNDRREKAMAAVERGERKTDVSRMMNISRNTLDLWLKRKEQEGNCQAITNYQQGCRPKITDWQKLRKFVQPATAFLGDGTYFGSDNLVTS